MIFYVTSFFFSIFYIVNFSFIFYLIFLNWIQKCLKVFFYYLFYSLYVSNLYLNLKVLNYCNYMSTSFILFKVRSIFVCVVSFLQYKVSVSTRISVSFSFFLQILWLLIYTSIEDLSLLSLVFFDFITILFYSFEIWTYESLRIKFLILLYFCINSTVFDTNDGFLEVTSLKISYTKLFFLSFFPLRDCLPNPFDFCFSFLFLVSGADCTSMCFYL